MTYNIGVLNASDRHTQTNSIADWCIFEKARRRDVWCILFNGLGNEKQTL